MYLVWVFIGAPSKQKRKALSAFLFVYNEIDFMIYSFLLDLTWEFGKSLIQ